MKIRHIGVLFCCVLVSSGCASKGSYNFFTTRYSVDTGEFDRGYEAGIAFAKTEGRFSSSPKDVPSSMQNIIATETDSFQKGFLAGYRDQDTAIEKYGMDDCITAFSGVHGQFL